MGKLELFADATFGIYVQSHLSLNYGTESFANVKSVVKRSSEEPYVHDSSGPFQGLRLS